jgi:DNA-directed RNA polymerase specialized sigma24 family protein
LVEDERLWELLHAVAAGGNDAWAALLVELEPELSQLARRQPIGRLRDREDTPREVVTRVLARLYAKDFAAIKKLCELDPRPELRAWLRVVVRRSAIDYMRESPEFERGNAHRDHRWVSLATLQSGEAAPDPDSLAKKRDEVLAFVRAAIDRGRAEHAAHGDDAFGRLSLEWKVARIHVRRLITRADEYMAVLSSVLAGFSYVETAEKVGTTRREVELTVRYIEEFLHARGFAGTDGDGL